MTTTNTPEIKDLSAEQLLSLRSTIDTRLEEIRAAYIRQCEALGLKCVDGDGKKLKRRAAKQHDAD